jgi:hypothetical protein
LDDLMESAQAKPHVGVSFNGPLCFLNRFSKKPRPHKRAKIELPTFLILKDAVYVTRPAASFIPSQLDQVFDQFVTAFHVRLLYEASPR